MKALIVLVLIGALATHIIIGTAMVGINQITIGLSNSTPTK